jgi:hypothetical protein
LAHDARVKGQRDAALSKKRKPENPPGFPPFFSSFFRANSKCEVIAQVGQISGSGGGLHK